MKFTTPKTLTGTLLPTLIINWVFGLGVIAYPTSRLRQITSILCSIVNFLIYLGFVKMANFSELVRIRGSSIGSDSYRIIIYLCGAFVVTTMCLAQIKGKIIVNALSKLTSINKRLDIIGISNDYTSFFTNQIIQLGIAFTVMFILLVLDLKYTASEFPSESSRFGYLMACYYLLMFAFVIDYSFSGSIRYFRNRFERLNTLLIELDSLEKCTTTVTQLDNQLPSCSSLSMIREIHGNNSSSIRAAKKQWLLYVIHETRKIHRNLCNTAMEWNRAFGIQVLLSVGVTISLLTALLFTSYTIIVLDASIYQNHINWIPKFISLMWIIFHMMKLILIVGSCEATCYEANRTGGLVSKLLNTAAYNEDIREEMNIFSLQLLQNPLIFMASGFFRLNYSLVHGTIGSVTTYLVIMIQMQSIYEPKNMNYTSNSTTLI